MADFALTWDADTNEMDLSLADSDIVVDEGLQTACLLSLFTDRRAEPEDLPGYRDLRGWWGDEFLDDAGDLHGSRLWQDNRSEFFIYEALQWMVADALASEIETDVQTRAGSGLYNIVIHRPQSKPIDFRFDRVWDGEAAKW